MQNTSITQVANLTQLTLAVGIMVRIFSDPSTVTAEEWQIFGLTLIGLGATIWSFINRASKPDMTGIVTKE